MSNRAKGNHSAAISAYWSTSTIDGILSSADMKLHVGVIEYFFKHSATIATDTGKKVISHVFACVEWYEVHPRESWFHPSILVVSTDKQLNGPSSFLPLSRILSHCALVNAEVNFDYGSDSVVIALSVKLVSSISALQCPALKVYSNMICAAALGSPNLNHVQELT